MSFVRLLEKIRRSLALRLSLWFALVFLLVVTGLFWGLYRALTHTIEERAGAELEALFSRFSEVYLRYGVEALRASVRSSAGFPGVTSLYVRLSRDGRQVLLAEVPPEWLEVQTREVPEPSRGLYVVEKVRELRIPQNARKDFLIAEGQLANGVMLEVGRSTDSRTVLFAPLRKTFWQVGGVAIVLGLAGGGLFAWSATRPIREVTRTARRILEQGQRHARVPVPPGDDELTEMARHFNTVLDKNEALLVAMRESLDNVAHDLRTPLTRLRGTAEVALQNTEDPAAAQEALADCVEESERVLRMLNTLMDVTEAESGMMKLNRQSTDLVGLLGEIAEMYSFVAEERKIEVKLELPDRCEASVDPDRMRQVLGNLVDNALKYTPEGGLVTVRAETREGWAIIRVRDTGIGVSPEEQTKIWTRLYRGDRSRSQRGLGLGLSLVKAVVEAHGGTVGVTGAPGQGSEFTVKIPVVGVSAALPGHVGSLIANG
ncbi:MAG: HAMP domain-containing protein [Verrucomicrobia bacterium]|nr:HAMP domain-containing protein [Verrucomicrobiota bacterium]